MLTLGLLFGLSLPAVGAGRFDGDASLSSDGMPHIPEPLLFDLVRPLGARKGELEINVLAQHNQRNGRNELAPEIEYVLADGLAIELELPFDGNRLEQYKFALQGTLGTLRGGTMVHGWQGILRRERGHGGHYSADLLYLNGQELGARWSTLSMAGLRRSEFGGRGQTRGLLNNSLFFEWSPRLTLGLELNHEIDATHWRWRAIPQIHIDLDRRSTLQLGLGPSRLNPQEPGYWSLDWRLIRTF